MEKERKEKRSDLEKNPIEKQRILKHPQNLTSPTNTVIREFLYRKVTFLIRLVGEVEGNI